MNNRLVEQGRRLAGVRSEGRKRASKGEASESKACDEVNPSARDPANAVASVVVHEQSELGNRERRGRRTVDCASCSCLYVAPHI